jgi:hypothetical protein
LSHFKISATEYENTQFCVSLHISPSEILQMVEEANGKVVMQRTQVNTWHKCGCASVNDDPCRGSPQVCNIQSTMSLFQKGIL